MNADRRLCCHEEARKGAKVGPDNVAVWGESSALGGWFGVGHQGVCFGSFGVREGFWSTDSRSLCRGVF